MAILLHLMLFCCLFLGGVGISLPGIVSFLVLITNIHLNSFYCWAPVLIMPIWHISLSRTVAKKSTLLTMVYYCWLVLTMAYYCWLVLATVNYNLQLHTTDYHWLLVTKSNYCWLLLTKTYYCWLLLQVLAAAGSARCLANQVSHPPQPSTWSCSSWSSW